MKPLHRLKRWLGAAGPAAVSPHGFTKVSWSANLVTGPFPVQAQQAAQVPVCGPDSCYGHYDASGLPRGAQRGCGGC